MSKNLHIEMEMMATTLVGGNVPICDEGEETNGNDEGSELPVGTSNLTKRPRTDDDGGGSGNDFRWF